MGKEPSGDGKVVSKVETKWLSSNCEAPGDQDGLGEVGQDVRGGGGWSEAGASAERVEREERKRNSWHQSKAGQVSAPLIIDPTAGPLTEEMREVCRKFEEVTEMRVVVQERAGNALKHLAKAEPLKNRLWQK